MKSEPTVLTIYKMLSKVVLFPDDMKYSKIRLKNANFQKKIAQISGLNFVFVQYYFGVNDLFLFNCQL